MVSKDNGVGRGKDDWAGNGAGKRGRDEQEEDRAAERKNKLAMKKQHQQASLKINSLITKIGQTGSK